MLSVAMGMSQEHAYADWCARVMRDGSDWLVCPLCQEEMKPYLSGKAHETTASAMKAAVCYIFAILLSISVLLVGFALIKSRVIDITEPSFNMLIGIVFLGGIPIVFIALLWNTAVDMTRELRRKDSGTVKKVKTMNRKSQPASSPQLAHELLALCEQGASGAPTTFICYGSDEALFIARLKPFSAYANTTNGRFCVIGVRDGDKKDFMIVCTGSKSEHAAFSAEGRSGGALDKLDHALLTEEELRMRRPVSAYSNFASPGCDLISLDGFNRHVSDVRSGRYAVVSLPQKPMAAANSDATSKTSPAPENATSLDADASLYTALAKAEDEAQKDRSVALRKIFLTKQLGEPVIAWSAPDDGTDFNSERARELLTKHMSPLGYHVTGSFVGGDPQDSRSYCYFYMYKKAGER
jgi:hypothetical protein